jgi:hypothetical protein
MVDLRTPHRYVLWGKIRVGCHDHNEGNAAGLHSRLGELWGCCGRVMVFPVLRPD